MAEHKLDAGKEVIAGLVRLGQALGYFVAEELPVEKGRRSAPAVDVAWLSEEGQDFPLMIFEVETRATSSIANNPVKVFSQPNQRFEKPLFFFHVLVSGGQDTSRVANLERLFGSHNYRAYRLDQADITRLAKDILAQHRRLHRSLDLYPILGVLDTRAWEGTDLDQLLEHIESLGFTASYLSTYAQLTLTQERFRRHFLRYLELHPQGHPTQRKATEYETFIGGQWHAPIHLGILALEYPDRGDEMLRRLRDWQERHWYLSMIGPHFGLSREYDDFILGIAPALWALVAALTQHVDGARAYIARQCRTVLEKLVGARREVSFFTAIWMLHISATESCEEHFQFAQQFINDRGGASPDLFFEPPSLVGFQERDDEWMSALGEPPEQVPNLPEFCRKVVWRYTPPGDRNRELFTLAVSALVDNNVMYDWAPPIGQLLHRGRTE